MIGKKLCLVLVFFRLNLYFLKKPADYPIWQRREGLTFLRPKQRPGSRKAFTALPIVGARPGREPSG